MGGNAFVTSAPSGAAKVVNNNGLANWSNANSIVSTYAKLPQAGTLIVKIRAKVLPNGDSSVVKLTINRNTEEIKELPIFVISASVDGTTIANDLGADGFIAKPFDMEDIISKINSILGG